jgi:ligand-binding sensor domain-containing protein
LAFHPSGGGLYHLSGESLTHMADPLGLAGGQDLNIQALTVASGGAVWIGAGCALGRLEGRAWQTIVPDCTLLQGNVVKIALAPDGAAWIAAGFNLARYADGTLDSFDRLANWLAVAPDGTVWVSGWEGRADSSLVLRYDGAQWSAYDTARLFFPLPTDPRRTWVGQIAVAPDGALWGAVAGYEEWEGPRINEGLASFDGHAWALHPAPMRLALANVSHLEIAPDGTLWTATDSGLAHFNGAAWTVDAASAGEITVLDFAPDGAMWVGRSDGSVARHQPREEALTNLDAP